MDTQLLDNNWDTVLCCPRRKYNKVAQQKSSRNSFFALNNHRGNGIQNTVRFSQIYLRVSQQFHVPLANTFQDGLLEKWFGSNDLLIKSALRETHQDALMEYCGTVPQKHKQRGKRERPAPTSFLTLL